MKKGTKPKPVSTGEKQDVRKENGQFPPGVSGNPAGRAKGSRNKLTEEFIEALAEDFAKHGQAVIKTVREEDPGAYLRTIASLVPKQAALELTRSPLEDLTDDQVEDQIARLSAQLGFSNPFKPEGSA